MYREMRYVVDLRHSLQAPCGVRSYNQSACFCNCFEISIPSSKRWECGNPEGFPRGRGKGGKPVLWLSTLSTLRHLHRGGNCCRETRSRRLVSPFPKTGLGGKCPDSPLPSRLSRTWMDSNGSMSHSPCLRRGELTLKKIHACKGRDQTFLIGNRAFPLLTSDRASDRFLFARQPNLRFPSYSLWAQSGPFT